MAVGSRFRRWYFDWVYAPVYDATVGQLTPYHRFQRSCVEGLSFRDGDRVLCVGVGTGNELITLLEHSQSQKMHVIGVDQSLSSLGRAKRKAQERGLCVELVQMDAACLDFPEDRFDRVLCLHTMDFLEDMSAATTEIVRVLRKGGQFVVSYPSGRGGLGLAAEVGASVLGSFRRGSVLDAVKESFAAAGAVLAYAPLVLWTSSRGSSLPRALLEGMMRSLGLCAYRVQEEPNYQDYIVWGIK